MLVLDEAVNVVLSSVFTGGDLEHKGNTQQSLLSFPVRHHLQRKKGGEGMQMHTTRTLHTQTHLIHTVPFWIDSSDILLV